MTSWAAVGGGLLLLVAGGELLVRGSSRLAAIYGLSPLVIGLTIVAFGTSAPELAVSLQAVHAGTDDVAVGNVVGSNIFNVLAVLGVAAFATPAGIAVPSGVLTFDFPVMAAVAVACLPIFFTGHSIARWEGALFLGYYVAYTGYLVLDATGHEYLPPFRDAMIWFALPLTAVTLGILTVRAAVRQRTG